MTILYFILTLGVLVFIHEFGHFLAAKKQGIGVEKFSLGFGPKLFGFRRGETEYKASALPFGGYVKLMGEDPNDSENAKIPREKNYSARPVWQKMIVVFAGPAMNLILALAIMPLVFLVGRMEPKFLDEKPVLVGVRAGSGGADAGLQPGDEILEIDGRSMATWRDVLETVVLQANKTVTLKVGRGGETLSRTAAVEESKETKAGTLGIEPSYFIGNEPLVDEVVPGGPADKGGVKPGDEIAAVDQQPVATWTDMTDKVEAAQGKVLAITVRRGGDLRTVSVTPAYDTGMKKWLIGIRKDASRHTEHFSLKRYGFAESLKRGFEENVRLTGQTLSVLKRLVTLDLSYKALGGPIRIAQASAMAAKSGLSDFLYFLAFLSIQLGVLNLLPVPVLDGGHFLFFAVEGVIRRPVPAKARAIAEQAFFFLLISLMLLVTLNDVDSVWGFREILGKLRNIF
ncbi:MAG TPA: RIP metalloprotease RseP [bacterium]|nr:RIP metalloprotease RseP [bacterium]